MQESNCNLVRLLCLFSESKKPNHDNKFMGGAGKLLSVFIGIFMCGCRLR